MDLVGSIRFNPAEEGAKKAYGNRKPLTDLLNELDNRDIMNLIQSTPGFWPDYYGCWKDNIVETINRMLSEHSSDFPNTCCVGFTIIYSEDPNGMVRIYPKVKNTNFTFDSYTKKRL